MRSLLSAFLVFAAVAVAACGSSSGSGSSSTSATQAADPNAPEHSPAGDIPDNQAYVAYTPPGATYSVKVPEGWSRTATARAVAFTDKLNTVRLEQVKAAAPPTVASVRTTLLPKLAQREKGYKAGAVTTVKRTSGKAVRITYLALGKPDPVTGKTRVDAVERYLFFRNGREAIVTLSGPKGADNVDPWRTITDSVRWTG
jgi:hypothetical protein